VHFTITTDLRGDGHYVELGYAARIIASRHEVYAEWAREQLVGLEPGEARIFSSRMERDVTTVRREA